MSSWGLWFWFSKVLWGNVFLKKHAMSKVFQNFYGQSAFFELFFSKFSDKLGSWGMIHTAGHRPRIQNLRFWYFLFTLIFKRMSFFKTVLWLVFNVLWLVLHVMHTRSSDHGPLFLPSGSSYSPTHTERRRRDLWNKQNFDWNKVFRYRGCVDETSYFKGYDSYENDIGGDGWWRVTSPAF